MSDNQLMNTKYHFFVLCRKRYIDGIPPNAPKKRVMNNRFPSLMRYFPRIARFLSTPYSMNAKIDIMETRLK